MTVPTVLFLVVFFVVRLFSLKSYIPDGSRSQVVVAFRNTTGHRTPWTQSQYDEFIKQMSNSTDGSPSVIPTNSIQSDYSISTPTIHPLNQTTQQPSSTPTESVHPSNASNSQTVSSIPVVDMTVTPNSDPLSVSNGTKTINQPSPNPLPSPNVTKTASGPSSTTSKPAAATVKPTPTPIRPTSPTIKPTPPTIKPIPPTIKPTPTPIKPTPPTIKPIPPHNTATNSPSPTTPPHFTTNITQKPSVDRNTSSWMPFIRRYRLYHAPTASKLLFVVNFHEPKYEAIPFIESQYFAIFRRRFLIDFDVVFVGPRGDAKHKVLGNGLPIWGYYSYYSLPFVYQHLCVEEECSYYGFVLMNDDSYVDPVFLIGYDLTQSWTEPSSRMTFQEHWQWYSRKNEKGKTYHEAFVEALEELKNTEEGKKCHFEKPENWRRGFADFFYITQKDMKSFHSVITVMKRHLVFLEMAAPTVNYCITHNFVVNCNHIRMQNRRTCVHMHPVKYRQPGMKEFALDRLYHKNLDSTPKRSW